MDTTIILALVNIPVYFLIGKVMFKTWEGFLDAIGYLFTLRFISAARGEFWDDWWAELKLIIFVLLCIGVVYAEYYFFFPKL